MKRFSQKHYEFLARFLGREVDLSSQDHTASGAVRETVIVGLARLLATELANDNPKFDRARFLAAVNPSLKLQ